MLKELDYKPSFQFYNNLKLDSNGLDPEISEIIKLLNFLPTLCTEFEFGSCYGFHGNCVDFPHLAIWYDEKCCHARQLMNNIVKNFNGIPHILINSQFSKNTICLDSYYERKISLDEIDKVQHLQISVKDSFFEVERNDRKKFCDLFWYDCISKSFN
ncbi:hypothetical protein HN385_02565 [archaeon]|nr:hypothetical protein [archaeon]